MHVNKSIELLPREVQELKFHELRLPVSLNANNEHLAMKEPGISAYWGLFRRRKWTVVAFAVAVLAFAIAASLLMTPMYRATGRISIARESSDSLGLKASAGDVAGQIPEYTMYLDAQVRILQSDSLIVQVARDLHWLDDQNRSASTPPAAVSQDLRAEAMMIQEIKSRLRVTRLTRTPVIEIRFSNRDPRMAAAFVNGLIRAYVNQNFTTKYDSVMQVSGWLSGQLQGLKKQVETSQEDLVVYQRQQGILGIDDKQNIVTAKLDELNRELTAAQTDRIHKQAVYENTITGNAELLPGTSENLVIQHLKEQRAQINNQYAQATTQLGPAHPKVMELKNQLTQVDSDLSEEIKKAAERALSAYSIALTREKMLHAALEAQKQKANQLNESAIQYNILKHDLQSNQQLYDSLSQTLKEAGVAAGLRANNVAVVDYARIPVMPSSPNIPVNLGLGVFLGCVGGGLLAFILEKLDPTLRTPDQFRIAAALHPIAIIPEFRRETTGLLPHQAWSLIPGSTTEPARPTELVAYSRPQSEAAESYRSLRTALLLSCAAAEPKVVLVTSALPYEGKTTTAVNCAVELAQRAARVLLIDADLRAPKIHHFFHMSSQAPGLSTLLRNPDTVNPVDVIVQSQQISSLFVLPAGLPPDHPSELLSSARMKRFLAQWRDEFDHIVIDTAPVLSATESVMLSVEADSVLLTVRSGVTPKDALVRARDVLSDVGAKVSGVVVNAVDCHDPSFGYSSYSYEYGKYRRSATQNR